jgi:hypothetical protein
LIGIFPQTSTISILPFIHINKINGKRNAAYENPKHFKGIRRLRGNANNRNQKPSKEIWEKEGFK